MINWTDPQNLKGNLNEMQEADLRSFLHSVLSISTATVTFTKKDGSTRVMRCTLDSAKIPKPEVVVEGRKVTEKVLRVYDLEINEWRSFTVASVTKIDLG